jgi:hypothetical protein
MTEKVSAEPSSATLPKERSYQYLLPTPFAAAGIGLLLAVAFPGGATGGEGFVLGLFIGIALSILMPIATARVRSMVTRCPNCGATVDCTRTSIHSSQASDIQVREAR